MSLNTFVQVLHEASDSVTFERFGSPLDAAWVRDALEETGTASVRRRKLPAEMAVWLVIGMALFRDRSIVEVVKHLGLVFSRHGKGPAVGRRSVAPSAIPQARARIGEEPLRHIFEASGRAWSEAASNEEPWHGLAIYGVDGSTFRVPDSPTNRSAFGLPGTGRGQAAYPQVRVVTLTAARSHIIRAARLGPCKGKGTGEQTLALELWEAVPEDSVVLLDKGFLNYGVLYGLHHGSGDEGRRNRHWCIRAKDNLKWRVVEDLGDGDMLVEVATSSTARHQHPGLPRTMRARAIRYQVEGHKPQMLLTSMLDPERFPALDIARLYHERWELELSYDEIKTHMLERQETLRSKSPPAVRQELWGTLIAFNLVRCRMQEVAHEAGVPPTRVSFRHAVHLIRILCLVEAWTDAPSNLPKHLAGLRSMLSLLILPERRSERAYERHVKIRTSKYKRNPGRPAHNP